MNIMLTHVTIHRFVNIIEKKKAYQLLFNEWGKYTLVKKGINLFAAY